MVIILCAEFTHNVVQEDKIAMKNRPWKLALVGLHLAGYFAVYKLSILTIFDKIRSYFLLSAP